MTKPVVFDLTHLVSRLTARAPSGIDRVDLAYARHFAGPVPQIAAGVHYGWPRARAFSIAQAQAVVTHADRYWREERQDDAKYDDAKHAVLQDWLSAPPGEVFRRQGAAHDETGRLPRLYRQWRFRLTDNRRVAIPDGAIYLNIAQHALEYASLFRWLDRRDDVAPVFFIHDLMPLDYPEYFEARTLTNFQRRFATAARYGKGFITASEHVRERLRQELLRRGLGDRAIHAAALPSPLAQAAQAGDGAAPTAHPYFVMIGTIEPRKNHLLVLNAWRRLIARDRLAPKLVLVGARGWNYAQIADLLDRAPVFGPYVAEVAGLPSADLRRLLRGAKALLMPSFEEGYGLPVVEALSLGVPVIASDIAVFREIAQGCAQLVSPLDGPGWCAAIERAASAAGPAPAGRFEAPTWRGYFSGLEVFLASL